jgi:formate hydrogenlyase transcriptional activator
MKEFLETLFSSDFEPHGHCYLWHSGLVGLHVVSDAFIALAYFSIPVTLIYFIRKRRDLPFNWMFVSFGMFILACGATHIMEVWTLWHGTYWLSGSIKAVTAMASVPTAILLVKLVPEALALPSPEAMKLEIAERKRTEQALHQAKNELELRVLERTAELRKANEDLVAEIAQRKQIEDVLRERERLIHAILDNSPALIFLKDMEERYLLVNKEFERAFEVSQEEIRGKKDEQVFPVEQAATFQANDLRVIQTGVPMEFEEVVLQEDRPHTHIVHRFPLLDLEGKIYAIGGIATDITERKRAEDVLRQTEAYLAEAQSLSHTGSFGWKVATGEILWSEETFRIYEYDRTTKPTVELIRQRVHPEDVALLKERIERASREGQDFEHEYRLLMPDRSVKHVHVVAHAARDESGNVEFIGAVTDVTAAKIAEQKLKQDEAELRQLINVVPELILVMKPDGSRLYANQGMLEYAGLTLEDVHVEDFHARVVHPDDLARVLEVLQPALSEGAWCEAEARLRRKDKQYRWFLIRSNPLRDERGAIIRWYTTATDIEDRKQAEEKVQRENVALREEIDKASMFEEIVGSSHALQEVLSRVAKVAPTDSTVLISGETGTGKELIARAIHKRSPRSSRAFVSVNCAAIPQSLIGSELFGHEKGAFTGATQRRLGRFELAEGGTIFLDEIVELPYETQNSLLRVLQEREFERVGGTKTIRADARVIAATNRDLKAAIAARTFREDLFYRLAVFPIEIPPLRERREDIPMLVEYFIDRYAKKVGKKIRGVNEKTLELLYSYPWPGNIRELQNVIERSVIVCETENFAVDESWLSRESVSAQPASQRRFKMSAAQEKEMIDAALAETRGRVSGPSGAAAKLGIPPSTLDSKIKSLKIDKDRFKPA